MHQLKKKKIFAAILISMMTICMITSFTAFADEVDLTDNDAAVEFMADSPAYTPDSMSEEEIENYQTAASTFIDNQSSNVKEENFTENVAKALDAKRDEVHPYATWLALLPPIIAIALALITK